MRVAVIYGPTMSNINGASDYAVFRENVKYVTKNDPNAYFYFCLPEKSRKHVREFFDRCEYVFYNTDNQLFYDGQAAVPSTFVNLFHARTWKFPVDAVWMSRTQAGAVLSRQLQDFRARTEQVPVFIEEFKPNTHEEHDEMKNAEEHDFIANILAYLMSYNLFDAQYDYERVLIDARRYLTASAIEEIEKRSLVALAGIDFELVNRAIDGVKKRDRFTFFVGGRLNQKKRPTVMLEAMERFFQGGKDVDLVVCTPTAGVDLEEFQKKFPSVEFHSQVPKREFLRRAAGCHAFVNASPSEGFATGYVEQVYAGLVPLFPNLPWVKNIIMEHKQDYPFLHDNTVTGILAKMNWVFENYEEAKRSCEPIKKMMIERYDREKCIVRRWQMIKEIVEKKSDPATVDRIGADTIELIKSALLTLPNKFSLDLVVKNMSDHADILTERDFENPVRGRPSRYMVYKWLKKNGYRDLLDAPIPWFQKVGT